MAERGMHTLEVENSGKEVPNWDKTWKEAAKSITSELWPQAE